MFDFDDFLSDFNFNSLEDFVNDVVQFLQDAFDWIRDFIAYFQEIVNEWLPIIRDWLDQVSQLAENIGQMLAVIVDPEFNDGQTLANGIHNAANGHVENTIPENSNLAFTLEESERIGKLASFGAQQDEDQAFRTLMQEHGGVIVLDDLN